MLDQLRKGLQLYDLQKVMEMHPDLCLPLFVPGEKDDRVNHCGSYGLTFPTAHLKTLNEFKNIMGIAMKYGESFDNV